MRSALLSLSLFVFSLPVLAQFNFTPVDVPAAVETQVRGINNAGEIVGFYRLAGDACAPQAATSVQLSNCDFRGFKIVNGIVTTLMVPGSLSTAITGINSQGDLVGFYSVMQPDCTVPMQHGFIWYHQNVIRTIDYGRDVTNFCGTDSLWTVPFAINSAGTVVGAVWSAYDAMPFGGFVWKRGAFTDLNPGGQPGGVFGIANRGTMVGASWHTFGVIPMWVAYTAFGAGQDFFTSSQDDTWATGVNNASDVVGYGIYGAGFLARHMAVKGSSKQQQELQPVFVGVYYPGAAGTFPFALNDQRAVVGAYTDMATGQLHGFMAAPTF